MGETTVVKVLLVNGECVHEIHYGQQHNVLLVLLYDRFF